MAENQKRRKCGRLSADDESLGHILPVPVNQYGMIQPGRRDLPSLRVPAQFGQRLSSRPASRRHQATVIRLKAQEKGKPALVFPSSRTLSPLPSQKITLNHFLLEKSKKGGSLSKTLKPFRLRFLDFCLYLAICIVLLKNPMTMTRLFAMTRLLSLQKVLSLSLE